MRYRVKQKRNGINDKELYYAIPAWSGLIGTREITPAGAVLQTVSMNNNKQKSNVFVN